MQENTSNTGTDQPTHGEQSFGDVDIEVQNADIGNFNLVIWAVITVICVVYFFTHLTP